MSLGVSIQEIKQYKNEKRTDHIQNYPKNIKSIYLASV